MKNEMKSSHAIYHLIKNNHVYLVGNIIHVHRFPPHFTIAASSCVYFVMHKFLFHSPSIVVIQSNQQRCLSTLPLSHHSIIIIYTEMMKIDFSSIEKNLLSLLALMIYNELIYGP